MLDGVTLLDETVVTEDRDTDVDSLQVECAFLRPQTRPIRSPTPRMRPVSSILLPTEEPAIRGSRMGDTSDAAGFTVPYERATAGAMRDA